MDRENGTSEVRVRVTVQLPPERAFDLFTNGLGDWWMPEYTWSGPDCLGRIGIEPREGGLCYEIGPYGFRMDWGRVLTWDPARRLVLAWQISPQRVPEPDPHRASEIEVLFDPDGTATAVDLTHRHFDRHGKDDAAAYRGGMAVGWQQLLGRYVARAHRGR